MKKTVFSLMAILAAGAVFADPATENFGKSTVQTQLQVEVKDGVEKVHVIRDNSDPSIITRAYELKNANPYAVRGYLLKLIEARSIDDSDVQVEALRFNDGKGAVLISAEDYRFSDTANGEGFESIISKLDTADLGYSGGSDCYIYYPRYNPAANLMEMLNQIGTTNEDAEFGPGTDFMMVDGQLNALLLAVNPWSWKHCESMLEQYDRPMPEVRVHYQVYEIYNEDDDRVGVDFQNWKNNDGVDFFSAGMRVRRNWSTFFSGNVDNSGHNRTEFWNFNPKWNTRYLDLLQSTGKAKILTSGTVLAKNRSLSTISVNSGFFYERTDLDYLKPLADATPRQPLSKILPLGVIQEILPGTKYLAAEEGGFYQRLLNNLYGDVKFDTSGAVVQPEITIPEAPGPNATQAELMAYYAAVQEALKTAADFKERVALAEMLSKVYIKTDSRTSTSLPGVYHGKPQISMTQDGFGMMMSIYPVVTGNAATLQWDVETTSLLGWNSDGTPRKTSSNAKGTTQVGFHGKELVIGGLHRAEAVRSVSGLPWLKSLPLVGYLFSDESESVKTSELVIVARCEAATPFDRMPTQVQENIGKITDSIAKGINSPFDNLGYQQLWLDQDTNGL